MLDQRKFAESEKLLREALEWEPDNSTAWYDLACAEAMQGRADAALDDLDRAAEAGFTDFTHLRHDPCFNALRDLPRYSDLLAREPEVRHRAAERALAKLREQFGERYAYDLDEPDKLVFAAAGGKARVDELKTSLLAQAASQWAELFEHRPDEFIRVVIASPADYARLERRAGVGGSYDDTTRTLLARQPGPTLAHEFTHALHAADQRAAGQEHAVWISEGLASMYERTRLETTPDGASRLVPLDIPRLAQVQAAARHRSLIPFDKLLTLNRAEFTSRAALAYGESAALMLYLYEEGLLRRFYDAYKAGYLRDPSGREALERTTGSTLQELQDRWTAWVLARKQSREAQPSRH